MSEVDQEGVAPVVYTPDDLVYSATARCQCGAGLAYPKNTSPRGEWSCAAVLTGEANVAEVAHDSPYSFVYWEIKSELQPSAYGATTRPRLRLKD